MVSGLLDFRHMWLQNLRAAKKSGAPSAKSAATEAGAPKPNSAATDGDGSKTRVAAAEDRIQTLSGASKDTVAAKAKSGASGIGLVC